MKRHYLGVVEAGKEGFGLYFPDLPGCTTGGDTVAELLTNAHEALQAHIDLMAEDGDVIPEPTDPNLDDERGRVPEADLRALAAVEVDVPYPGTVSISVKSEIVREITALADRNPGTTRQFIENATRRELDRLKQSA